MIFGKNKKIDGLVDGQKSVEEAAISRWRTINSDSTANSTNAANSVNKDDSNIALSLTQIIDEDLYSEQKYGEQEYEEEVIKIISDENTASLQMTASPEMRPEIKRFSTKMTEEKQEDVEFKEIPVVKLDTVFEESPVNVSKPKNTPVTPIADFSVACEDDLKARFGNDLKSALGSGTVIEGIFSFNSPVRIDGVLKGEIRSNSALIVGKKAKVHANIKVGSLIVLGTVEGEVEADDLVEIRSSGQLIADITTSRLALEEGGVFSGSCAMI